MHFRSLVRIVVSAALLSSSFLAFSPSAGAEVYTCGTHGNYHDGKYQAYGTHNYLGASAGIVLQYGAVCDTNQNSSNNSGVLNFTSAYVMIASGAPNSGWAQAGFTRSYNNVTYFFAQTSPDGTATNSQFSTSGVSLGTRATFVGKDGLDCTCAKAMVNGNAYITTTWNPQNRWISPFSPQYEGEASYLESDMPGNASQQTNYSGLQYEDNTGTFNDYPCSTLSSENAGSATRADNLHWYNQAGSTCPNFNIYTD